MTPAPTRPQPLPPKRSLLRSATLLAADLPRLVAALYVWNFRKARFVASGRRRTCPCQAPCDSGRAVAPGCDAVIGLRQPGAFRAICPAIRHDADGEWRCSVPAAEVRPHAGRFFLYHGIAALGALTLLAVGWQIVLRSAGYSIHWIYVAWPGNWSHVHALQSRQLLDRARLAVKQADLGAAQLALSTARRLDETNFEASLLLAELQRLNAPFASDAIFRQVIDGSPALASTAAQRWLTLLVARGDFVGARALAADRLRRDNPAAAAHWFDALLFAERRAQADETLDALSADGRVPAPVRRALRLVVESRTLAPSLARQRLERAAAESAIGTGDAPALALVAQHLGFVDFAGRLLAASPTEFSPVHRIALELELCADPRQRTALLRELLRLPPGKGGLVIVAGELLRRPDRELAGELLSRAEASAASLDPQYRLPMCLAVFCAIAANGEPDSLRRATALVASVGGGPFPGVEFLSAAIINARPVSEGAWMPLLDPVPLTTLYALHDRLAAKATVSVVAIPR